MNCDRTLWEHFPWVIGLDGKSLPDDPCFIYQRPGITKSRYKPQRDPRDPTHWEFT